MRLALISCLLLPFGYGKTLRRLAKDDDRFTNEYREAFAESDRISTAHLLMRQVIDDFELSELAPSLPFSLLMGTRVLSDGNGDYFSTLSSAGAIRESFTAEELDLNVVYVREQGRELPNVDLEEYGLQEDHVFDLYQLASSDQFDTDLSVAKAFREADAVLSTPVEILGNIKANLEKHPVSMYVTQYGGLSSVGRRDLGLDSNELGIDPTWATRGIHLLNPEKIPSDDSKFVDEKLAKVWKIFDCDEAWTKAYFGYKAESVYYELIAFLSKEDHEAERIVIFNSEIPANLNLLSGRFASIKTYSMTNLMEIRAGTGERELILVKLDTLDHSDFLRLMKRSEPFVACTGDMSLSEAISLDKLPFYLVPLHNRDFWINFQEMVRFYFKGRFHPLNMYLELLGRNASPFEYGMIMNPIMMEKIVSAWIVITDVIKRDFNSKTHLKVLVKELAARAKYGPKLIKFQEHLA